MKLTLKQIRAGFGGKRRRSALRKTRKPRKEKVMARRGRSRRFFRRGRRGKKGFNIAGALTGLFAAATLAEPMIPALQSAANGDLNGALQGTKTGAETAVKPANLIKAFTPYLLYRVVKGASRAMGAGSPRIGKVRVF